MDDERIEPLQTATRLALALPRGVKRAIQALADAGVLIVSLYFAGALRLESLRPLGDPNFFIGALASVPAGILLLYRGGVYRTISRYANPSSSASLWVGATGAGFVLAGTSWLTHLMVPRSVPVLYSLIAVSLFSGVRAGVRKALERGSRRTVPPRRIGIYGAGAAGRQFVNSLTGSTQWRPVAFFDDDPSLQGNTVLGLPVYNPRNAVQVVEEKAIEQILLAIPSLAGNRRTEILNQLQNLEKPVLTVPSIDDLASGRARIDSLQSVDVEELLGRDPVPPLPHLLKADVAGKVVLVTGAGGSIGSELCRQALLLQPSMLILYEVSEFALYSIDCELKELLAKQKKTLPIFAILGSVRDRQRLEETFRRFSVTTVYHAAAYKHVPIVEHNLAEGIMNNSIGTYRAAQAAIAAQVEAFVLISTDKAVRPTNAMGASKRVAELVCQALAAEEPCTRFSMVRFGNVLGSSGSVVPLFKEQIRYGGPVTVTHRDVVRYFMTIPEAAQLVMQAGAMGIGGEVYVLEMGDGVRIDDLAKRMIKLSGLSVKDHSNPDGDIEIQYVGLRPGEKLVEELLVGDDVTGTIHPKILCCKESYISLRELEGYLGDLEAACATGSNLRAQQILASLPTTHYTPEDILRDHLGPGQVSPERYSILRSSGDRSTGGAPQSDHRHHR